jgi:hypothetical protein
MASEPIKSLLEQALASLSDNRPQEAIEILDRIGTAGEKNPDQLSYRGLAMAKLGETKDATRLLRAAVQLDPAQSRLNFALAVHLREIGQPAEARKYAETVRTLDPKFPGLTGLLTSLGLETKRDPRLRFREMLYNPLPTPPDGPVHAFPAIEQGAKLWTTCGWVLVCVSFVGPLMFRFHLPYHLPGPGEARGLSIFGGAVLNVDPLSVVSIFIFITAAILSSFWTIVDMLDRRSKAFWIIPLVPCCCLGGMPGIGQALYMSMGRR